MDVSVTDSRWWLASEEQRHLAVTSVVRDIRKKQEGRKLADLRHASFYAGRPITGFGVADASVGLLASERISLNVIRNMVGSVVSKIASKNKPKPTFLTEGGNYEMRTQAQNLEKFVGGVFYESKAYSELPDFFRDSCVFGTGALKVYADEDDRCVAVERTPIWEVVVDDGEGKKPRNLYQRKYVDRLVLAELYPDMRAQVLTCANDAEDREYGYQTLADQVLVTEAWHLGETKRTKGRHTIAINNATLLDEEWDGDFPFVFLRWTDDVVGFFGVGLAEELLGLQREINELLREIQKGHALIKGFWAVLNGSTLTSQINNDLGAIVKYTGQPPNYFTPQIISPEVYQHLWQLYAKAFEIAGISQLNATGQKPAGLNSGAAQRAYQDIQTERFLEVGQAYEDAVIELAKQVIRCAKKIGGGYRVRSIDKNSIDFIKWSDVDLDDDAYVIRVYPTSLLPSTPAGKLAWAEDMMKAGIIPPEDVLDIVDFPDTESYAKRKNAARTLIERNISHMLKQGEAVSPEPFDPHELALKIVNEAYHEARLDGVPDDRLQLLRDYMTVTKNMMPAPPPPPGDAMPPPQPAPPPDPMGAPPPMPMAA